MALIPYRDRSKFLAAQLKLDLIQAREFLSSDDLRQVFTDVAGPSCLSCLFRPVCPVAGDGECKVRSGNG